MVKIYLVAVFAVLIMGGLDARVWTSREGATVEAELVAVVKDKVTIRLADGGKELNFELSELSLPDRGYIEEYVEGKETADREALLKKRKEIDDGNYHLNWPEKVEYPGEVEIVVAEQDKEKKRFVYQSPHYEFICDVRLNPSVVKGFAKLFEATFQVMVELPMNFSKATHFREGQRMKILLFETRESYVAAGGPPSSGGVYMSRGNLVMVPLRSLGVKKVGSGYMLDRKVANQTLSHELVHQLTDWVYYAHGARGWFTEGISEYVSTSPYLNGKFNFVSNIRAISESVSEYDYRARTGSNLGDEIIFKDLKGYMLQSYGEFTSNARFNYAMGMVLTTYFIHMDDGGSRKRLTAFLKAMRAGDTGEKLLESLLDGRSWDELEAEIAAAWRSKGLKLIFKKGDGSSREETSDS